jgi:hypothetical protein
VDSSGRGHRLVAQACECRAVGNELLRHAVCLITRRTAGGEWRRVGPPHKEEGEGDAVVMATWRRVDVLGRRYSDMEL